MTIYCEDAKAAEITFSLTGGREGKIVSENPPVNISFGKDCIYLTLQLIETVVGDTIYPKYQIYGAQILSALTLFSGYIEIPPLQAAGYSIFANDAPTKITVEKLVKDGQDINTEILYQNISVLKSKKVGRYYTSWALYAQFGNLQGGTIPATQGINAHYMDYENSIRAKILKNNIFIIADATGIIYAQEYPEGMTPTYAVTCINCPPGLCACRGKRDKIHCVDCSKIINGLSVASRSIETIYG